MTSKEIAGLVNQLQILRQVFETYLNTFGSVYLNKETSEEQKQVCKHALTFLKGTAIAIISSPIAEPKTSYTELEVKTIDSSLDEIKNAIDVLGRNLMLVQEPALLRDENNVVVEAFTTKQNDKIESETARIYGRIKELLEALP